MIRAAVYEGALERFAGEIEHMIDSRGMSQYKGTGDRRLYREVP